MGEWGGGWWSSVKKPLAIKMQAAFQREGKVLIQNWNQNQIKRIENKF